MSATILNREGNKTRYLNQLYRYFPQKIHTYAEPFFGTGSVFLNLPSMPQYSFVNDHDKIIYYFFLIMQTKRGAEKLATAINNHLIYHGLLDAMVKPYDLIDFLARKILKLSTSLYNYSNSLRLNPCNEKKNLEDKLFALREIYLDKLKYTKITKMNYDLFLNGLAHSKSNYKNYFIYCDPPYVLKDKGRLESNKNFADEDIANLVDILQSKNWLFAISCMDSGVEYYKERGLFVSKVAKNTGIAYTKGNIKYEWIATNYPPPIENYSERDLAWD